MDRDEVLKRMKGAGGIAWLDLLGEDISEFPPEFDQLPQLWTVKIQQSHLRTLSPRIGQLSQLRSLELPGNQLNMLPPEIGQLTQLHKLDLGLNHLTALPPELGQLTQLETLELAFNRLTALPPEIGELTQLRYLSLTGNEITSLPSEIGNLTNLQRLYLNGNRLTTLPPEIANLTNLQELYLGENRIAVLPPEIGQLVSLTVLSVGPTYAGEGHSEREDIPEGYQAGELRRLPSEISRLSDLSVLDLRYNRLPIPPEILANTDEPQAIIDAYVALLERGSRPLNEVKMVLVGQGSVGKTSLVNRLLDGTFDPPDKTEGIDIRRWSLGLPEENEEGQLRVNVWDFGGQEIMHATHQFFLTRRTLYLLVLDNRLSETQNRLDYWLQIIRSFGGDSPIILVGNKADQQTLDIDRGGIRDKYSAIKAIVETSCVSGEGLNALQAVIAAQIPALPHVFDELLISWFDVKTKLEEMHADYVPYAQYVQMCREAGVTKERSQRTLLGFLHDLGIVLHFPDPRLETTNILNPEWVTQGVYRILNSHALFQSGGVLTRELLAEILDSPEYPRDKHFFIVDMMRKFELCYPFPGQDHTYLVPDLLPKEERYTGTWNDALVFQVHYNVLPSSVFSRFIVRMHRCIHQHTVWRTGVLLAQEGNEALVRADLPDNRILIQVRGPTAGRRDLLTRIREQLDAIHHTIQGLQAEEKVPLPGRPGTLPVDYRHLRNLERAGIGDWIPEGLTEPISVSQLLNGVEPPSARRARRDGLTYTVDARGAQIGAIGDRSEIRSKSGLLPDTEPKQKETRMDPITGAIVAAVAAGVASGAGEVGKRAIVDGYEALKGAIQKKFGQDSKIAQAVAAVEEEPDFEPNQQTLAGRVEQENAAEDPELQELAQELLEALEATSQGEEALSKYDIHIEGGQVGGIGDSWNVEGGIHLGSKGE